MFLKRLKFKYQDWRFERRKKKQRKKQGFADADCWGLDYWLCDTFPKMIENLRDMKHGAPELPFEEVDNFPSLWRNDQTKILLEQKRKNGYDEEVNLFGDKSCFDRWWLVLSRIAYCLKEANIDKDLPNEYEEEFNRQVWGDPEENRKLSFKQWWMKFNKIVEYDEKGKPKLWQLVTGEQDEAIKEKYFKKEEENFRYKEQMKDEAFDLIKKYFYNLWD